MTGAWHRIYPLAQKSKRSLEGAEINGQGAIRWAGHLRMAPDLISLPHAVQRADRVAPKGHAAELDLGGGLAERVQCWTECLSVACGRTHDMWKGGLRRLESCRRLRCEERRNPCQVLVPQVVLGAVGYGRAKRCDKLFWGGGGVDGGRACCKVQISHRGGNTGVKIRLGGVNENAVAVDHSSISIRTVQHKYGIRTPTTLHRALALALLHNGTRPREHASDLSLQCFLLRAGTTLATVGILLLLPVFRSPILPRIDEIDGHRSAMRLPISSLAQKQKCSRRWLQVPPVSP